VKPGSLLIPILVAAGVVWAFFASDSRGMERDGDGPTGKARHADPPPGEIRAEAVFAHPTGYR
jgi:hypothetical protein